MEKIWIEYLRFIALLGVITIHSTGDIFIKFGKIDPIDWWVANVLNTFSRFSVPLFVMISGCVLLGRNIGFNEFYIKRGIRLIPAFLFWSLFYSTFSYIVKNRDLNIILILKNFALAIIVSGRTYPHLWYLSMFICLMVFTPFINNYILTKKPTQKDFFYMFIAFSIFLLLNQISIVGREIFDANMLWFKLFIWFIPYFIMGYIIETFNHRILISNNVALASVCLILVISTILNYLCASKFGILKDYFILANTGILNFIVTLLIFYLFSKNRDKFISTPFVKTVSSLSFGIYLIHPFFIKIFHIAIGPYLSSPTITIALTILTAFIFSLLTIYFLDRFKWFKKLF